MTHASPDGVPKGSPDLPPESTRSESGPAPGPLDLEKAMEQMPDGPNVEASPWEVEAARGETALQGPRAEDDPVADDKGVRRGTGD